MTPTLRRGLFLLALAGAAAAALVWLASGPDQPAAEGPGRAFERASTPPRAPVVPPAAAPPAGAEPPAPAVDAVSRAEEPAPAQRVVRGRVESAADGSPVPGGEVVVLEEPPAFVRLLLHADAPWKGPARGLEPIAAAPVDADGRFELHAPDRHGFLATAQPGFLVADVVPLPRDGAVTLRVRPAGRLTGRVEHADGSSVAAAEVRLGPRIDPMEMARGGRRVRDARRATDGDGRFTFEAAPIGELVVRVAAAGAPEAIRPVELRAGETTDVTVVLEAGFTLAGRVVTEAGAPVEGARVRVATSAIRLAAAQRGEFVENERSVTAGAGGRFVVRGLPRGEFDVVARAERFAPGKVRHVALPRGEPEGAGDVVVVLRAGRTISGRVVDPDGAGIPDAVVGVFRGRGFFGMDLTAAIDPDDAEDLGGASTRADEDGRFESPPLPEGTYDVVAAADGFTRGSIPGVAAGTGGHEVALAPSGAIHGIVLSRADGEPVTPYWITAACPFELMDMKSYLPTDVRLVESEDGTFVLDDVDAGDWIVKVAADGFGRAERPVRVAEGEAVRGLIVLLPPEARVRGLVLSSATGRPIEGASVSTRSGMEALRPDVLGDPGAKTDREGRFEIGGLPAGRLQLSVRADDHAPGSSERLTLVEGGVLEGVVIRLDAGAVIRGRVTAAGGAPVEGAMVQAVLMGTVTPAMTHTDAAGRYALTGLAPGAYTVNKMGGTLEVGSDEMLSSLMRGLSTKTVRVRSGEEVVLDFAAGAGGTVLFTGRVTEAGDAVESAIVSMTPDDLGELQGELRIASTDGDGVFELEGMQPGEWTMTVQSGSPFGQSTKQSFDVSIPAGPAFRSEFELSVTGFEGRVTSDVLPVPLEGVRVAVDALDEGAKVDAVSRAAGSRRVADVFTDGDGRYRVKGLRPGRYRVVAGGPGMFGIGGSGFRRSEPREVEVRDGELVPRIDFRLRPGGSISGRVVDREQRAVTGATVFLVVAGEAVSRHFGEIVTDEAGRFEATGLDPDRYTMIVKAGGLAPAIETGVRIRESEETVRDVTLREGAELTLALTDAGGASISAATVCLFAPDGTELTSFVTIADAFGEVVAAASPGHHSVGALEPGVYTATIEWTGGTKSLTVQHGTSDQTVPVALP